jgi:DNA-binding transcriptional LysR family regulator
VLDDLQLFVEIVKRGSFAKTAADLKITPATLSKRLSALERKLNSALLTRTSRGVILTTFGKELYEEITTPMNALQNTVTRLSHENVSSLRILCPQNLIVGPLFDVIWQYQQRYPELALNIEPSNHNALLSQKPFEVAFRVGKQDDSSFYQRRLGEIAVSVIGPRVITPDMHLFLAYSPAQIAANEHEIDLITSQFAQVSQVGDITLARKLVEQGRGAALLPMTEVAMFDKKMKNALRYYSEPLFSRPIYALWPNSSEALPAAKALIEMALIHCEQQPALSGKTIALGS